VGLRRRAVRVIAASAVVATAALGLTACESKIGQAAVISGHGIGEGTLNEYVTVQGPNAAAKAQAAQNKVSLQPKVDALSQLIVEQVFSTTLARLNGKIPTAAALAKQHDTVAQSFFQTSLTGAQFDSALDTLLAGQGYTRAYRPVLVRSLELEFTLIQQVKASTPADLAKVIAKERVTVSVASRYGSWDPNNLTLTGDGRAGLPSFVTGAAISTASTTSGS
jgi:hypothetical protein